MKVTEDMIDAALSAQARALASIPLPSVREQRADALRRRMRAVLEAAVAASPGPKVPVIGSEASPVRRGDPTTSRVSAFENQPRKGNQRERVLRFLVGRYDAIVASGGTPTGRWGLTASGVEQATQLPSSSCSKRLGELERGGYVTTVEGASERTLRGGVGRLYRPTAAGLRWCRETPVGD